MKKSLKIGLNSVLLGAILFSGCASSLDPTPKAIDVKENEKKMSGWQLNVSVKKGENLQDVIKKLQDVNKDLVIVDKTRSTVTFDRDIDNISIEELKKFIKLTSGEIINFRKYSEKIMSVEEKIIRDKKDLSVKSNYKIPKKMLNINGEFTYEELFSLLREEGINIYTDLYKKDYFDTTKKVPEFSGNLEELLNYISKAERLFIMVDETGIKLKDVQTVLYNLKLPKIDLSPAISADGASSTVVTVQSALSSGSSGSSYGSDSESSYDSYSDNSDYGNNSSNNRRNNSTRSTNSSNSTTGESGGGDGSINPLDAIENQLKEMFKDNKNVTYHVNKTNGSLSITADYESIKIADMIVEDYQEMYDTAIKIEMHIYQVALNNDNAFGIDYQFIKNKLIGDSVVATQNVSTGLTDALSLTATAGGNINFTNNKGLLVTSDGAASAEKTQSLIFKYLNKFGRTSVVTKPTLETVNNLPVNLDIVDSRDYVANIEKNSTANTDTGSTSSGVDIQVDTVTTGYSLVLHPKIDGEYIQVALKNISSVLNSLDAYTYQDGENSNTLYLKNISARQFNEIVKIKEGEIAIIGGYMSENKSSLKNGMPFTTADDQSLDAFTSAKEKSTQKYEIVITISAQIL